MLSVRPSVIYCPRQHLFRVMQYIRTYWRDFSATWQKVAWLAYTADLKRQPLVDNIYSAGLVVQRVNGVCCDTAGRASLPVRRLEKSMPGFNRIWRVEHATDRQTDRQESSNTTANAAVYRAAGNVSLAQCVPPPGAAPQCRKLHAIPSRSANLIKWPKGFRLVPASEYRAEP